jgi:nitroreductase
MPAVGDARLVSVHHEYGPPANRVRPLLRVRQVRQFTDEPLDPDAIEAIADAARWSGSSRNSQPWRFVIVRKKAVLRRIAEAGLPQTRSLATATAAIAIAVPQEQGSAVSHAFDEGRAAERMLIAASLLELGAGIAWVRTEIRPVVSELLGLAEDRFVRTIIALGHPTDAAREPKSAPGQARLPRAETVFHERYGEP